MTAPTPPLWRDVLVTLALGGLIAVLLFALYLGIAIVRSAW